MLFSLSFSKRDEGDGRMRFKNKKTGIIEETDNPDLIKKYKDDPEHWKVFKVMQ